MVSPFSTFANATLTFEVVAVTGTVDEFGNKEFAPTALTFRAMLSPVKDTAQVNYYVGDDDVSELMSGYLVEPTLFPDTIASPTEGIAEVKTQVGVIKTGTFKLLPMSQSPYLMGVNIDFLTKIQGVFTSG